jgi:symplekin
MASAPLDPLQTLQAALHKPANSQEQADLLAALRDSLEARPQPLPILCATLLNTLLSADDSLLKRWVLDLIHYGIARAALPPEARTQRAFAHCVPSPTPALTLTHPSPVASQSLDVLVGLLHDSSPRIVKVAIEAFCGVYPLLFLFMCARPIRCHVPAYDPLQVPKPQRAPAVGHAVPGEGAYP